MGSQLVPHELQVVEVVSTDGGEMRLIKRILTALLGWYLGKEE
jgi:hypothetical protein